MTELELERIMEVVCDRCHFPFATEQQEDLDDICAICPVEKLLREVMNL